MIISEIVEIDGMSILHQYSDQNRYLIGGEPYGQYEEAYDPVDSNRTYIEGEVINSVQNDETLLQVLHILLGEEE